MPVKRDAAYYRQHNKEMKLAMELGVTPAEARAMMERVEARERHRALCRKRGHETVLPPLRLPTTRAEFERFDCRWMVRD